MPLCSILKKKQGECPSAPEARKDIDAAYGQLANKRESKNYLKILFHQTPEIL